mmetsp:Transcript_37275/g.99247  ORF Transcript_37275/g.99247 Transcript_37275/m.99247 type:complete len:190 (-) Transcript_37275:1208-1777(-)
MCSDSSISVGFRGARCWRQNASVSMRALTIMASLATVSVMLENGAAGGTKKSYAIRQVASLLIPIVIGIQDLVTLLVIGMAIGSKWLIMGRRRQGRYNWDESSYCQRWQVYLSSLAFIRSAFYGRGVLEYIRGSAYLVWYFRILGAQIGKDVCLYPLGADPMMTEPDLVQIGDQVSGNNLWLRLPNVRG